MKMLCTGPVTLGQGISVVVASTTDATYRGWLTFHTTRAQEPYLQERPSETSVFCVVVLTARYHPMIVQDRRVVVDNGVKYLHV